MCKYKKDAVVHWWIAVCVVLFKAELNLFAFVACRSFYSSRSGCYTESCDPTGDPRVVKLLYSRALLARSSK
jgi:hypothetical protein